jgi:hypothetical protein
MRFITLYSPLVNIKSTQTRFQLLQPTRFAKDMYNNDGGKGGAYAYEVYEVK